MGSSICTPGWPESAAWSTFADLVERNEGIFRGC